MSSIRTGLITFATAAVLVVGACGDNNGNRQLVITDPQNPVGGTKLLCLGDDHDTVLAGVQYTVHVQANGFKDGDLVELAFNGAQPDPQLAQPVANGEAIFANVTFPVGNVSLVAWSMDLQISSDPVALVVNVTPPPVSFTSPIGGATIHMSDDVDSNTAGIQLDLAVSADVEDGQNLTVSTISPSGVVTQLTPVKVMSKTATVRATFVEQGTWQLRADASTACGNPGYDLIDIGVGQPPTVPCVVEITPTPRTVAGQMYPVLNYALDPDHNAAGFQAIVKVHSLIGNRADLFINLVETSLGTVNVVDDGSGQGVASFAVDLPEGTEHVQAQCRDKSSNVGTSMDDVVFVDTIPPVCNLTAPADNHIIIPAEDIDTQTTGTQFAINATVAGVGGDTEGQLAVVTLDGFVQNTSVHNDAASVIGSLNSPKNNIPIQLDGQDAAGNTCTDLIHVSYATQGCGITWVSPTSIVTTDSSGSPGIQANLTAQVDMACAGKTVSLANCDINSGSPLTATASANGTATWSNVTLCSQQSCPRTSRQCLVSVTNDASITTSLTETVTVQTQPPSVSLATILPANVCGGTMTAADDANAAMPGTQVKVSVASLGTSKWVESPPGSAPITVDGSGNAFVTLSAGANPMVGKATDDSGLTGTSSVCTVTLSTLALSIQQPGNGALLGASDGVVSGSNLTLNVCGFVGEPTMSTVTVTYDQMAAADVTATIDDTVTGHWCASLLVPSGSHTIDASATSTSTNSGTASISVTVKLTPPDPPTNFSASRLNRNTILVGWTAPADGTNPADHCTVKGSNTAIPDVATFNGLPGGITVAGASIGTLQTVPETPLKTGKPWFFGVRCYDAVGNASGLLTSATATTLELQGGSLITLSNVPSGWDLTGSRIPGLGFGYAVAGGDIDGDGYSDLIVSDPGACNTSGDCTKSFAAEGLVYVFRGGPTGIATTPSFIIEGTDTADNAPSEELGRSITTLDWNHDGYPDIAISAPYVSGVGKVYIFLGGPTRWVAGGSPVIKLDTAADVTIQSDGSDAWLTGRLDMGLSLTALDFDGDSHDDLLISVSGVANFDGGAFILFGPTSTLKSVINVPTDLTNGSAGTTGVGFMFPGLVPGGGEYGYRVANLGKLGNVAGDTRDDFAIAPEPNDYTANQNVTVFLFWGRAQSTAWTKLDSSAADESVIGPQPFPANNVNQDRFGDTMASIQDQNGDGKRELVISDYTNPTTGHIWVIPAGIAGAHSLASAYFQLTTAVGATKLGVGLANPGKLGGDVDGDGQEDLVCSTLNDSITPAHVDIRFGNEGTSTAIDDHFDDTTNQIITPSSLSWIGDANKDGFADLVWASPNGAGTVQVLY